MRRRKLALAAAAVFLISAAPAMASDELCGRLETFKRADFKSEGRRWVEVHWVGAWMDFDKGFGLECTSSTDAASQHLCTYLKANTSIEFPRNLPFRILDCHGYALPTPYPRWSGWRADIDLWSKDRLTLLEVDLQARQGSVRAIRLSTFADGRDPSLDEVTPLSDVLPPLLKAERR